MAATKGKDLMMMFFPTAMEVVYYSTLDAGANVVHTLKNQTNVMPFRVHGVVTTQTLSGDPIFVRHVEGSWDNTDGANTITLIFDTIPGGDLSGGVVKVFIEQLSQASGGISASASSLPF
jgi:hypothetical protein